MVACKLNKRQSISMQAMQITLLILILLGVEGEVSSHHAPGTRNSHWHIQDMNTQILGLEFYFAMYHQRTK